MKKGRALHEPSPYSRLGQLLLPHLNAVRVGLLNRHILAFLVFLLHHLADRGDPYERATPAVPLDLDDAYARRATHGIVDLFVIAGERAGTAQRGKHVAAVRRGIHQVRSGILAEIPREQDRSDFDVPVAGVVRVDQVEMPVARPEVLVVETDHPVRVAAVAAANQLRHAALREGTEPEGIYIMIQGRGWPSPTRIEVHIGSDLDAPASCRSYGVSRK